MGDAPPPEASEPVADEPPVVATAPVSASSVDEPTVAPEPVRGTLRPHFRLRRRWFET
jgi:hypothetical protein